MSNELIERLDLWIAEYDNPSYSQIVLLLKDCKEALEAKPVLTNPYTGQPRDYRDVESDPEGTLMADPTQPLLAVPQATLALDYKEVDTIRQWYNCIHDVNYSYLVDFDHRLMDRVCKYIKRLHKGVNDLPPPDEAKPVGEPVAMRHDGYVLVPVDEASNIIAMRKALEEIIEWTDRYTSPDHPITIFAKKALSAVKEKE